MLGNVLPDLQPVPQGVVGIVPFGGAGEVGVLRCAPDVQRREHARSGAVVDDVGSQSPRRTRRRMTPSTTSGGSTIFISSSPTLIHDTTSRVFRLVAPASRPAPREAMNGHARPASGGLDAEPMPRTHTVLAVVLSALVSRAPPDVGLLGRASDQSPGQNVPIASGAACSRSAAS